MLFLCRVDTDSQKSKYLYFNTETEGLIASSDIVECANVSKGKICTGLSIKNIKKNSVRQYSSIIVSEYYDSTEKLTYYGVLDLSILKYFVIDSNVFINTYQGKKCLNYKCVNNCFVKNEDVIVDRKSSDEYESSFKSDTFGFMTVNTFRKLLKLHGFLLGATCTSSNTCEPLSISEFWFKGSVILKISYENLNNFLINSYNMGYIQTNITDNSIIKELKDLCDNITIVKTTNITCDATYNFFKILSIVEDKTFDKFKLIHYYGRLTVSVDFLCLLMYEEQYSLWEKSRSKLYNYIFALMIFKSNYKFFSESLKFVLSELYDSINDLLNESCCYSIDYSTQSFLDIYQLMVMLSNRLKRLTGVWK